MDKYGELQESGSTRGAALSEDLVQLTDVVMVRLWWIDSSTRSPLRRPGRL